MKKYFTFTLALILVLSLAACGGKPAPTDSNSSGVSQPDASEPSTSTTPGAAAQDPSSAELSAWLDTKTGRFYSQFANEMYMEYEMEYDGSVMTVISASSGDKSYAETKMDGQSAGVSITDSEYMYAIDHASKTVVKVPLQTGGQEVIDTMVEEGDVDPAAITSGKRDIDGKTYDTEEWSMDGAATIMCFDGDTLAYMIASVDGEETVLKILKTSDKVDSSLFTIPADYQVMSY